MALPLPRTVRSAQHRRYHRWRRSLQLGTSALIVLVPFLGLLRVDLPGRSLVLLRVEFSLQELAPIFGLLMLGMLAIFAGALIYGRLWCGWACPQTVLSELATAIERRVVGKQRDSGGRRALAAALQLGVAAFVAGSIMSYLLEPAQLLAPPPWALISWAIATAIIAVDLLSLRHRVCMGICPYGILQGIVQDARSLRVELVPERASECVGCEACVRACFMGVDVREPCGELACISCGDCIDAATGSEACPAGLIRFRFPRAGSSWPDWMIGLGISDLRRALVATALPVLAVVLLGMLLLRDPVDLRFSPRYEEARLDEQGVARNLYAVTVGNRRDTPLELSLEPRGLSGLEVEGPGATISLEPRERRRFELLLRAPKGELSSGAKPIVIHAAIEGEADCLDVDSHFFVPRRARP